MPKISVIVPVYRAEAFLHKCVDGILSQTFSDFEVLLVDDGSPDGSGAICDSYLAKDSRVQVIHQHNQGQAAARNHAIIQAQGEWVCFVDSDDLIHPQMLQRLYESAEHNGAGISMCPMVEAPELPADFLDEPAAGEEVLSVNEQTLCQLYDRDEYPSWVACAKLIRREYIEQYPFHVGRVYEDNEAVCRWVCWAGKLARMEHKLYFYRTNPESTTQKAFSVKRLDYLWALESIIRFYDSLGFATLRGRFLDIYADMVAGYYITCLQDLNRPDLAKNIKKNLNLLKKDGISLNQKQFETIFDAMHPRLIRLYWPLSGALRTLKENGMSGVLKKAAKVLGKGADT